MTQKEGGEKSRNTFFLTAENIHNNRRFRKEQPSHPEQKNGIGTFTRIIRFQMPYKCWAIGMSSGSPWSLKTSKGQNIHMLSWSRDSEIQGGTITPHLLDTRSERN